jgi:hypothetical protein
MDYFIVRIRADTWDRLRDLQRVYDLDVFRQTATQLGDTRFEIQGRLSEEQIGQLAGLGYQIETIADASKTAKERLDEISRAHLAAMKDRKEE